MARSQEAGVYAFLVYKYLAATQADAQQIVMETVNRTFFHILYPSFASNPPRWVL